MGEGLEGGVVSPPAGEGGGGGEAAAGEEGGVVPVVVFVFVSFPVFPSTTAAGAATFPYRGKLPATVAEVVKVSAISPAVSTSRPVTLAHFASMAASVPLLEVRRFPRAEETEEEMEEEEKFDVEEEEEEIAGEEASKVLSVFAW